MPYRRVGKHWKELLTMFIVSAIICCLIIFTALAARSRANELNMFIYNQCVRDQSQDAIIIAQLKAARRRARATLGRGTTAYFVAVQPINDGILALQADPPCKPPKGVGP